MVLVCFDYYSVIHSDEKRTIKKILLEQMKENREGTWYNSTHKLLNKYNIDLPVNSTIKSQWKRQVKKNIRERTGEVIRKECAERTKTRTVRNEPYKLQEYLKELPIKVSKEVLLYRLHMINVPMNYKNTWKQHTCPLCKNYEGTTEHYFVCQQTKVLRKVWGVTCINEKTLNKMSNIAGYMKDVQTLLEPKWDNYVKKKDQK